MKTTIFVLLLLIGVIMSPQRMMALFVNIPLPDVVKGSPIVLVGKIEKIEENKYTSSNNLALTYDVAIIRVKEILKNNQTNVSIIAGQTIPLSMPSKGMERICSRAINYDLNQEGVWILDYKNGYYEATYLKDFQPLSEIESIREIISKENVIQKNTSACSGNQIEFQIPSNDADKVRTIHLLGWFDSQYIEILVDKKIIFKGRLYPSGRSPQITTVSIPSKTDAQCELQIKMNNELVKSLLIDWRNGKIVSFSCFNQKREIHVLQKDQIGYQ